MNNRLYVQINESTDITAGKYIDGSVFVSIGQKDRLYPILDINNSGENNSRELGIYLHFRDVKDIEDFIITSSLNKGFYLINSDFIY